MAVLGIIALLTWAPAYLAQDPAERGHSEPRSFALPPPRIGDEAVLEFVIHRAGHPTVTIPNVETVRHTQPNDEDCPVDAVLLHERDLRPLNVTFGWGSIERDAARYWMCFDAKGRAVWGGVEVVESWGIGPHWKRIAGVPEWRVVRNDDLVMAGRTQVVQNPAPVTSLADEGFDMLFGGRRPDTIRSTVTETLHHREEHYLAGQSGYSADWPWEMWDDEGIQRTFGPSGSQSYVQLNHGQDGVLVLLHEDFVVEDVSRSRHLVRPDWPAPVGAHLAWGPERESPDLVLTLAPSRLHRGEGPEIVLDIPAEVPYEDAYDRYEENATRAFYPPHAEVPVRQVSLADLSTVSDPLLRGTSLAELHAVVEGQGDEWTQDFLANGAFLTGFAWTAQAPEPFLVTPEEIPRPVQLPDLEEAKTDELVRTNWMLLYTNGNGRSHFVLVDVNETSQGKTYHVSQGCDDHPMDLWRGVLYCDKPLDRASIDPSRPLAHPADLVERARQDPHRSAGSEADLGNFVYMPALRDETPRWVVSWHGENGAHGATAPIRHGAVNGGVSFHTARPDNGFAAWSEYDRPSGDRRSGGYTIDTAAPLSRLSVVDAGPGVLVPTSAEPPASGSPPTVIEITATTAATAGILLILASLLARVVSSMKTGVPLAVLAPFFSRISKDRALLHERRADIMSLIEQEPGMTAKEIAGRFGFAWGVTAHHLEKLVSNGLLATVQNGQMRHYFPQGIPKDERLAMALCRDPKYRSFLDAVASRPGASLHELVDGLPQRRSGASRTGTRLERLGLIEKRREGRTVRFYPAQPS